MDEILEYDTCITRLYCMSHMLDNLTQDEMAVYPFVLPVLQAKVMDEERELDISGLQKFCEGKRVIVTEVMCRRLVNKFEFETEGKYFIIINGSEDWAPYDKLRREYVQAKI